MKREQKENKNELEKLYPNDFPLCRCVD